MPAGRPHVAAAVRILLGLLALSSSLAGRCESAQGQPGAAMLGAGGQRKRQAPGRPARAAAAAAAAAVGRPALAQLPRQRRLSLGDRPGELVVMWSTIAPTNSSCVQLQLISSRRLGRPHLLPAAAAALDILERAARQRPPLSRTSHPLASLGCSSSSGSGSSVCPRRPGERPAATGSDPFQQASASPGGEVRTVCGSSRAFVEPSTGTTTQYLHQVVLGTPAGMQPGQRYMYRVGCLEGLWSAWTHLAAPRGPCQFSEQQPASLLVVGDLGFYNSQTVPDLVREVHGGQYDALLHIGDLAYDLQGLQGRRAAQFLRRVEPLASRLPYMVLPGNHEVHYNFSHYRELFTMPNRPLGENLFYSFDIGPMHVLVYNTEVLYWPDSFSVASMRLMYDWMEHDLQAANRNRERTPWVMVAGHRPMYCAAIRGTSCDWGWVREHEASRLGIPSRCSPLHPLLCPPTHADNDASFPIEGLFYRYGVDIAVFGHQHDYERDFPVYNLTVAPFAMGSIAGAARGGGSGEESAVYLNPRATVHVVSGAGGNAEMHRGTEPPPSGPCNHTAPWCAFQSGYAPQGKQSSDYSYSRVKALNASHLYWEQYTTTLKRVVDSWWLVQEQHGPFNGSLAME